MPKQSKTKILEERLKIYEESLERISQKNSELIAAEEGTFLHSPTYIQMQEQITFLKNLLDLTEINLANQKKRAAIVEDNVRQIYEDNKKMLSHHAEQEHGYFIGITENHHDAKEYMDLKYENIRLETKVSTLKESLKERESEIERLQLLLGEKALYEADKCAKEEVQQSENEERASSFRAKRGR